MADVFVSYARSDKAPRLGRSWRRRGAGLVGLVGPGNRRRAAVDDQIERSSRPPRPCWWSGRQPRLAHAGTREAREAADRGNAGSVRSRGHLPMTCARFTRSDPGRLGEGRPEPHFQALLRAFECNDRSPGRIQCHRLRRTGWHVPRASGRQPHRICVLPFAQHERRRGTEYFSGRHQPKTSHRPEQGLGAVRGGTQYGVHVQGKSLDVAQVARQLKSATCSRAASRKAGGRVRITAQLIEGDSGGQIWAERYDRDLNDIFALQDEISEAIVKALGLKLLRRRSRHRARARDDN